VADESRSEGGAEGVCHLSSGSAIKAGEPDGVFWAMLTPHMTATNNRIVHIIRLRKNLIIISPCCEKLFY